MQWSSIEIQTERLKIKPFSNADADEAFAAITPSLTRFMAFDPPPSRLAFEAVWRQWLSTIADGSDLTFVIRHSETGRFIGLAGLHNAGSPDPELGIWVSERDHGHGYGREAVRAVARWGATAFSPVAFRYPVAEDNHPSRRIAESMGGQVVDSKMTQKYASVIYRIPSRNL